MEEVRSETKKVRAVSSGPFLFSELEQIYFSNIIFLVTMEDPAFNWYE
jgi:hypothetical protein